MLRLFQEQAVAIGAFDGFPAIKGIPDHGVAQRTAAAITFYLVSIRRNFNDFRGFLYKFARHGLNRLLSSFALHWHGGWL